MLKNLKKDLIEKNTIKRAEKLFEYLKFIKNSVDKKYPILDESDVKEKENLIIEITLLIEELKNKTKLFLNKNIDIDQLNQNIEEIKIQYKKLKSNDPVFNAIVQSNDKSYGGSVGSGIPSLGNSNAIAHLKDYY